MKNTFVCPHCQGVLNPNAIRICLEYLKDGDPDYPVIVDAGVGTASDVTAAMELGVDGVPFIGVAKGIDRDQGKEEFYRKVGLRKMKTGMALFRNAAAMTEKGFTD